MKDAGEERRFGVDLKKLPPLYPTHGHSPIFLENLGRTIATPYGQTLDAQLDWPLFVTRH